MKNDFNQALTRNKIIQLRKSNGYSQEDVAKLLKGSRTYYCSFETGSRKLNEQILKRLAKIYNIKFNEICVYTDTECMVNIEEYHKLESCIYHTIESNFRCIIEAFDKLQEVSPNGINDNAHVKQHLKKIQKYIDRINDMQDE